MRRLVFLITLLLVSSAGANYFSYVRNIATPCHYFRLDEPSGTTAIDRGIGCTNGPANGTYTGGFTLADPGALHDTSLNPAVTLNGTTGYVDLGGAPGQDYAPNATLNAGWSIAFWVKKTSAASQIILGLSGTDSGANHDNWEFYTDPPNYVFSVMDTVCNFSGTTVNVYGRIVAGTPDTTAYQFIVATTVGAGSAQLSSMKLYVNASLVGSKSSSFAGSMCNDPNQALVHGLLGRDKYGDFTTGSIDEVTYYNVELTQNQINTLYNSGLHGTSRPYESLLEIPGFLMTKVYEPVNQTEDR